MSTRTTTAVSISLPEVDGEVLTALSLGLGISIFRSCLINGIFFSNFEWVKKKINALEV